MRYFANINNPEELKKAFRAYCVTMHPDKGGNAEEFKNMLNEYEQAAKNCGAWTKETRETVDEWQEILRKCKHTTQQTELRVGDLVFVHSYEKPDNLSDFWECLVDYYGEDEDHKPSVGKIEAIVNMTDEEVANFDFFNAVPSGAGEGGTSGPYYDNEPDPLRGNAYYRAFDHEHYITNYTLVKTPTTYFFIDCEGYQYTRVFAISEDFHEMQQYKEIKARKEREEAERKAAEEEAERKAAEKMRAKVAQWSDVLERVPVAPYYNSSKGEKAAYIAAVKRNIKAVFAHYFPGVKMSIVMSSRGWDAETTLKWEDGPTLDEVEAVAELSFFAANVYKSDPYADYGDYVEIEATHVWREAYGESYKMMKFDRSLSAAAEAEALRVIVEKVPVFAECTDEARVTDNAQLSALFRACYPNASEWRQDMTDEERKDYRKYNKIKDLFLSAYIFNSSDKVYLSDLKKLMRKYYSVSADVVAQKKAEADAPKFAPRHNNTYRAIKKALGSQIFATYLGNGEYKELTILEAAEKLKIGLKVELAKHYEYEGKQNTWKVCAGGYKIQRKRAEKFAAVGFIIDAVRCVNKGVIFTSVSDDVCAELRKDAESVEEQRKKWESAQREDKTAHKAKTESKATSQTTEDTANDDAPAEGLELVEIPGGVAVVGGFYDTLRNRKQIKAHGARWHKEAKQWQATDAEAVARLREWFGMAEPKAEKQEQHTHTTESEQPELKEQANAEEMERVTRFAALVADVVRIFEAVAQAATEEAQRAKETATKQVEAEQLRADIAKMSAQVSKMSEALRTMSAKLAELEAKTDAHGTTENEPQPEAEAQERPERGEGKPDALDMLRAAAEDVERLTAANDPTAALLARLYVLAAVGLRVRPLIERAKAIEAAQQRGHLTPDEVSDHQRISQETERRAALLLTPEEFRTLYGYDPKTESKAA